jgi:amino acid transporter
MAENAESSPLMSLRKLLFGRSLRTKEEQGEKLGPLAGVPVLGLDALSSAAYGPEAALAVLLPLGLSASNYIVPITLCILGMLLAVFFSYRQTIPAYPNGGGSFTVAKENLGRIPGLLAASALSIDYILNVAVGISAGVGALVSAVPSLLHYTLPLCLVILALLGMVNLRGIRSAGLIFMVPTYLFVGCLGGVIVIGVVKILAAHGQPVALVAPPTIPSSTRVAGAWLLLRAFASGCTALTGVEAVSNAVPIFREPSVALARRTLTIIIAILGFLLAGVSFLSHGYHIGATPPGQAGYQSVLSQLVAAVSGRGVFYFVTMASILLVLSLSANTSFADFPRVWRLLALDEYLPAQFAHRGSRLVYSAGIVVLTLCAGVLLIAFGGITDRLIPLFAVGAFLAFTLSQSGMVAHWRRTGGPGAIRSLIFNGAGAIATSVTLIIIVISKFTYGAWISILLIPPMVLFFLGIRRYHDKLYRATEKAGPLDQTVERPPVVVIPLKRLDRVARKALRLGVTISPDVLAVQILAEEMKTEDLTGCWDKLVEEPARQAGHAVPRLVVVSSAYREFYGPLLEYLGKVSAEYPDRTIAVMVPEIVDRRWYSILLRQRATLLKGLLLMRGGPRLVIITIPWHLDELSG